MTQKQALESLKYEIDEEGHCSYIEEEIHIAMAALKKQIPLEIREESYGPTRCKCGHEFSNHHGDGYYSVATVRKTKYCPNCGQALKWR